MKNTFSKSERLSSTKRIEELFRSGESFKIYPLKITFFRPRNEAQVSVLISAPKHHFKHANERNLIKRRIREAYRKNKHNLIEACKQRKQFLYISFQYANKKIEDYSLIEGAVKNALMKLEKLISLETNLEQTT